MLLRKREAKHTDLGVHCCIHLLTQTPHSCLEASPRRMRDEHLPSWSMPAGSSEGPDTHPSDSRASWVVGWSPVLHTTSTCLWPFPHQEGERHWAWFINTRLSHEIHQQKGLQGSACWRNPRAVCVCVCVCVCVYTYARFPSTTLGLGTMVLSRLTFCSAFPSLSPLDTP